MPALELRDKIPPHNEDAEKAALGAMLNYPEAVKRAKFNLKPTDFYKNANALVCEAIYELYDTGTRADIITVINELKKNGNLEAAGGEPYVSDLTSVVSSSANIDYYAKNVKECSLRRALIKITAEITAEARDTSKETANILTRAQNSIFDLVTMGQTEVYKKVQDILRAAVMQVHDRIANPGSALVGVPSGFAKLDNDTQGFQESEMIIIGARPSMGKTALALNMATYAATKKIPAAFFSLEMSENALAFRILSAEAKMDSRLFRTGFMPLQDYNNFAVAAARIYNIPLFVIDKPNMKLNDLISTAMRLKADEKIGIIFIDYLQLIVTENNARKADYEQVSEVSRELKSLAKKLKVPVVALSQVGRPSEGNRPNLASLRGSGSIEQDADVVMFLHRDRPTDKSQDGTPPPEVLETELIVAKNRNGAVGEYKLGFRSKFTLFQELAN